MSTPENPVFTYGGHPDESHDAHTEAPMQTAGHGDIPCVDQSSQDPLVDQTPVDPQAMTDHVQAVFDAAHDNRQGWHEHNVSQIGSEHVGEHDFPSNYGT